MVLLVESKLNWNWAGAKLLNMLGRARVAATSVGAVGGGASVVGVRPLMPPSQETMSVSR